MTCHPCADHITTCDHCYSCDVLGTCCIAQPTDLSTESAPPDELSTLRGAIAKDSWNRRGLSDLIQIDAIQKLLDGPITDVPVRFVPPRPEILQPGVAPDPIFNQVQSIEKEKASVRNHSHRRR